ncbi:sulfatase [Paenibacillus antri]|uniref:Sulfatase n=1 Tax=Paenibacillus antri TaxID=2582848 RepID=A0A5R9G7Y5_9BACL|nr:sulfatase [Paenibacillus antri]TLS51831.1 sulfatase [Paenibacillus antri]
MSTEKKQPNIVFIMSDDHAAHAIGSYGSKVNRTPNIDRIAQEGMRFDRCYCTNSICAPSRAAILTGLYNHLNGVETLGHKFDGRQTTFPKLLQASGYQTGLIGKWHLGHGGDHDPTGFDYWCVLPGQGDYHNPLMYEMGRERVFPGYVSDIVTDISLEWLQRRDPNRPFLLMCHHKAPHRPWEPDDKHMSLYEDEDIPEPDTFDDDYENRSEAARRATMRVERDLDPIDLKREPPPNLTPQQLKRWKYQRYMKDYLRCIASVDDNVGRLLDYLDREGIAEETLVVYTSDQGFFLGDHGWYDKRFMYEESLRMPFLVRYPREVRPGSAMDAMALNVDFAPTFLDLAGVDIPSEMQGSSLRPLLQGRIPDGWRTSMYYRYWEHMSQPHRVASHYGIRTQRYKLIYYYGQSLGMTSYEATPPEWELFDLERDPRELNNVYDSPAYAQIVRELKEELSRLQAEAKDVPVH